MGVVILADNTARAVDMKRLIKQFLPSAVSIALQCSLCEDYSDASLVVIADLSHVITVRHLRRFENNLRRSKRRVFVLGSNSRLQVAQAFALGATNVMINPNLDDLLVQLVPSPSLPSALDPTIAAADIGASAIRSSFASIQSFGSIDLALTEAAGKTIADSIAEDGLSNWLSVVRKHHENTYQHCLLVTGVAVDFGLHLGLTSKDIRRLYLAAMLHDIGKAAIPVAILDKPGKLNELERAEIETHPGIGYDALKTLDGITPELLDGVRHHHEFLDGSGYPDRLCDTSISDLVRMLTISDIFSALIERRSYKEPMTRENAYNILTQMRGKLETPLVNAFSDVALFR